MRKTILSLAAMSVAAFVSGCASTMNVGESTFACKEQAGCPTPVEVYNKTHNAPKDVLVGKTPKEWRKPGADVVQLPQQTETAKQLKQIVGAQRLNVEGERVSVPLRRGSQVARVWVAPWVDDDDRLHWARYIFAEVSGRRWQFGERDVRQEQSVPFVQPLTDTESGIPSLMGR